jgi:hypothetical protein
MENCLRRVSEKGKVGNLLVPSYADIRMAKKMKKAKIPVVQAGQPDLVALSSHLHTSRGIGVNDDDDSSDQEH